MAAKMAENSVIKAPMPIPPTSNYVQTYGNHTPKMSTIVPLIKGKGGLFRGLSGYITNPPSNPPPIGKVIIAKKSTSAKRRAKPTTSTQPPTKKYKRGSQSKKSGSVVKGKGVKAKKPKKKGSKIKYPLFTS